MKQTALPNLCLVAIAVALLALCDGPVRAQNTSREATGALAEGTNAAALEGLFRLQKDEANAAFLGRQCAIIWFASESKVYNETEIAKDLLSATVLAKVLRVPYSDEQFRNAFKKTGSKVASDFDTLFPQLIEKGKNAKVRDAYLFSFWTTAARAWVGLVPLWKDPTQQSAARKWVAVPLAKAERVASAYDSASESKCHHLCLRSLKDPLDTFNQADKFASEIAEAQKPFLTIFLTPEQVGVAMQPLLKRKR